MCTVITKALCVILAFQSQIAWSHGDSNEFEHLTEQLYEESEPNIFPHVKVNLQGLTSSSSRSDEADLPLLTVDECAVYKVPTIAKLLALFDNYEMDASKEEDVTFNETIEEKQFIDAVLDTKVMKTAMRFLNKKGYVGAQRDSEYSLLHRIWFDMYPRTGGRIGSSGFEHVFLNEMKNGSPIGLHNWIYFHYKENGTAHSSGLDYKGYMRSVSLGSKGQIIKYRMSFNGVTKPVNSMFVGTPPELDMALFTVCFVLAKTQCEVSLNGHRFEIRAYPFNYNHKRYIGATYPVI